MLSTPIEELKDKFLSLKSSRDVAVILNETLSKLTYYLYKLPIESNYRIFQINKKTGGNRTIYAPSTPLKYIQRKLNLILKQVYSPKRCVQGYIDERSIVTNAKFHVRRGAILNIDIKDFFPSINFGRVRGMFMAWPYNIPAEAATILAQICCVNGHLAQGAPTSPIISNMLCAKLDSDLSNLAHQFRCIYTRYADDITFSSPTERMPPLLGKIVHSEDLTTVEVGEKLKNIIEQNGFEINISKTRIQRRNTRQEVTGLVVNKFPNVKRKYIREIRAIIHAIKQYGMSAAEKKFHSTYYKKQIHPDRNIPDLPKVLEGKLNYIRMVKGEEDIVYRSLINQYLNALGRPLRYVVNPLEDIQYSLCILECEKDLIQGTAFCLKNIGLITCDHVIGQETKAFKHNDIDTKIPVTKLRYDKDLDIAILDIPFPDLLELEMGDPSSLQRGDKLFIAGFQNYRLNDTPQIAPITITGFRKVTMQKRMLVSTPIIGGQSGGPVYDSNGKVVGIAATGADRMEDAGETEHHSVIPITAITSIAMVPQD